MSFNNPFRPLKRQIRQLVFRRASRLLADDSFAEQSMSRLADRVAGKQVALVGNARALLASGAGQAIDAHEFVMRFNFGFVEKPEHQGRRTAMVGVSGSVHPAKILRGFPDVPVCYLSSRRDMMRSGFLSRIERLTVVPLGWFLDLETKLGAKPSSGLVALSLMRRFSPKSITIYGFDWKKTPSFYTHLMGPHDWTAEAALVRQWEAEDVRLTIIDPNLPFNPAATR